MSIEFDINYKHRLSWWQRLRVCLVKYIPNRPCFLFTGKQPRDNMNKQIEFYYDGLPYTSRQHLSTKYHLPHGTLQRLLASPGLDVVEDGNKYYYPKALAEVRIETYLQSRQERLKHKKGE